MADEITITHVLDYNNAGLAADMAQATRTVTVTGTLALHNVQSVGTSEERLEFGDLGTLGYMVAICRDATASCSLRADSGLADMVLMRPGEINIFRLAVSPYVISNGASAVDLEYWLIED